MPVCIYNVHVYIDRKVPLIQRCSLFRTICMYMHVYIYGTYMYPVRICVILMLVQEYNVFNTDRMGYSHREKEDVFATVH